MADVTAVKTMNETDSLVFQCMDYTKQLASQGKAFKFSLSLPSGFNFSLDFSQEKLSPFRKPESKKQSPSTLRRNTQRRKDYLAKKSAEKNKLITSMLNLKQQKQNSSVIAVEKSLQQITC